MKTSLRNGGMRDDTNEPWPATRTAETRIIRVANVVRNRKMSIQKIKDKWYRLDVGFGEERLTFFGYSREQVRHRWEAWVRSYDLSKL
jgi:hypothetical protein